jgi:omega-6 fatty acid desaturase (delta-12 desaturase)
LFTECAAQPLAAETAICHEGEERSLARGLVVFGTYGLLYVLTLIDALGRLPLWANVLFAIGNGLMIAMLFIVGHDCQHRAFVPGRTWNAWLGRLAFLPCLHAGSLWRYAHHTLHHRRTNLKGVDPVWAPMSVAEFRAASPARRLLERIYRGAAGPLIYYYAAFWPFAVLLPFSPEHRGRRLRHLPDTLFVLAGFVLTLLAIVWIGHALTPERPIWLVLALGWVLPFAVWNYMAGVSFYLNHTHPDVPWFDREEIWSAHGTAIATTTDVTLPLNILPLYNASGAHAAHHERPATPIYELEAAQERLNRQQDGKTCEYTFTVPQYRRIVAACKLFDFERMCWTDFAGAPTSPRLIP